VSLPQTTGAYGLGPGEGEALWFNGALGLVKASAVQTDGRFAAVEFLAPKGFLSPLHIHRTEDEFFVVLSGEVRVKHGETVIEAVAGSLVYGPRNVAHAFRVDSAEARLLLFFGPAGVERFFREAGKPARSGACPPPTSRSLIEKRSCKSGTATARSTSAHRFRQKTDPLPRLKESSRRGRFAGPSRCNALACFGRIPESFSDVGAWPRSPGRQASRTLPAQRFQP